MLVWSVNYQVLLHAYVSVVCQLPGTIVRMLVWFVNYQVLLHAYVSVVCQLPGTIARLC